MKPYMSMITLGVEDMHRSVEFYRDGLGLPQLESPPSVAFFTLDGTWLGLFGKKALAQDAGVIASLEDFDKQVSCGNFSGIVISHNVADQETVDRLHAQVLACGAKNMASGRDMFWGGYCAHFADLDGYLWEIAYNPFMWVGPEKYKPL